MPTLLTVTSLAAALFLIGFGPALLLLGKDRDAVGVLAVAPLLGLALVLLAGSWLVRLNLPVSLWALPFLMLACLASLTVARFVPKPHSLYPWQDPNHESGTLRTTRTGEYFVILVSGFALLLAPTLVGGPEMFTLRGNLIDDVNYMIGARCFDLYPLSFQQESSVETLLATDPGLLLIKRSLWSDRVPIVILLAWGSRISFQTILHVEWGFTLTFFLLAIGPTFLLCRELSLPRFTRWLVCMTVCCGFWAQVVLDLRAMGQIVNLPLTLGLLWAALQLARAPTWRNALLFSLLLTASCLSYPEMVPSLALGLGACFVFFCHWLETHTPRDQGGGKPVRQAQGPRHCPYRVLLVSLLLSLALLATQGPFFWRFFAQQIHAAVMRGREMNWENDWFRFLYEPSPLQGFWGLSWGRLCEPGLVHVALLCLSVLLSVVFAGTVGAVSRTLSLPNGLVAALVTRANMPEPHKDQNKLHAAVAIACFSLAFVFQWLAMVAMGNPWAGAKALSYGYPYFILLLAGACLNHTSVGASGIPCHRVRWARWLGACNPSEMRTPATGVSAPGYGGYRRTIPHLLVLGFLLLQLGFAGYRIAKAPSGETFFVYGSPLHRSGPSVAYDREMESFGPAFASIAGQPVWTLQPEIWDFERFNLAFGDRIPFAPLLGADHYTSERLISLKLAASLRTPTLLLVGRAFFGEGLPQGMSIVHETKRNRLLRIEPSYWDKPVVLGILDSRSGALVKSATAGLVSAGLPVKLWLHAPKAGLARVQSSTVALAASSSRDTTKIWRAKPGKLLEVPLAQGLNEITLLGSGEHSVDDLRLSFEP